MKPNCLILKKSGSSSNNSAISERVCLGVSVRAYKWRHIQRILNVVQVIIIILLLHADGCGWYRRFNAIFVSFVAVFFSVISVSLFELFVAFCHRLFLKIPTLSLSQCSRMYSSGSSHKIYLLKCLLKSCSCSLHIRISLFQESKRNLLVVVVVVVAIIVLLFHSFLTGKRKTTQQNTDSIIGLRSSSGLKCTKRNHIDNKEYQTTKTMNWFNK